MTRMRNMICSILISTLVLTAPVSSLAAVTVTFPASDREIVNPYIGNATWATDGSGRPQPFTLVYAMLEWAKFEPEENVYDFESFERDNHFDKWREEGKRVIFRFVMDLPGDNSHRDIPNWLWEKTGKDGTAYRISYGRGYSPNYENPVLIEAHARAIAAIGDRYGRDPFFAYVQLGSLGHWGEWHVHVDAGTLPLAPIRDRYVTPYFDAFPVAKLMMRRPFPIAKENNMGLFNDTSGQVDSTETWLDWIESGGTFDQTNETDGLVSMADAWMRSPIGGELSTRYDKEEFLNEDMLEDTLRLFELSHTSWIGPGSFVEVDRNSQYQEALDRVIRKMGYRLRVSEIEVAQIGDDSVSVNLTWENSGIAPFYFGWTPSLRITGSDGSEAVLPLSMNILDILPDKPVQVTLLLDSAELPKGDRIFYAGIINPATGKAEIDLAMDTPREDNWFELLRLRSGGD